MNLSMPRVSRFAPALALVVAAAAAAPSGPAGGTAGTVPKEGIAPAAPAAEAGTRKAWFMYQASYANIPKSSKRFDIWVPLPIDDEHQTIADLTVQAAGGGEMSANDAHGNRFFHGGSGPRGGVVYNISVQFVVTRKAVAPRDLSRPPEDPAEAPANLLTYLEPSKLVPLDGEIKSLSSKIAGGRKKIEERARAIFDWVVDNVALSQEGEGWGEGDLKHAISTRKGNSLDLSTAFVGLARASGIPARNVIGFKLPRQPAGGNLTKYHAWAEFWMPAFGWIPVDPADASIQRSRRDASFGAIDEHRVRMSTGRDLTLAPPQAGGPVNFFLYPYAELDGKDHHGGGYRFTYDVAPEPPPPADPAPVSGS